MSVAAPNQTHLKILASVLQLESFTIAELCLHAGLERSMVYRELAALQGVPQGPNALLTAKALGFTNLTPDNSTGPPLFDIDLNTTSIGYTYGGPSSLADPSGRFGGLA